MFQLNTEMVECKQPLLLRKFPSLCIGSGGITAFIMFIMATVMPDLRPPDAPPASPMPFIIMGVVYLLLSVWAWYWLDMGMVRADSEGIRFGRSKLIKWNEVVTCSIRNFATRSNPDGVAFVLADAAGSRLFAFSPFLYLPEDANRLVSFVKLKLSDKIIMQ